MKEYPSKMDIASSRPTWLDGFEFLAQFKDKNSPDLFISVFVTVVGSQMRFLSTTTYAYAISRTTLMYRRLLMILPF